MSRFIVDSIGTYYEPCFTIQESIPRSDKEGFTWNDFVTVSDRNDVAISFKHEVHAECFAAALNLGWAAIAASKPSGAQSE